MPDDSGAREKKRPKRAAKPAQLWLDALCAPYQTQLKRKAWLETLSGVMTIAQAAALGAGAGALITDKAGLSGVAPFALLLFLVIALRALLTYWAGRIGHKVSSDIRFRLRMHLADQLAAQSPLDIERHSPGEIAALGSDVIESLDAYASRYLSLKLQLMVIPVAITAAAAAVSWVAALILMVCGPLVPIVMAIVGIRAKKAADNQISALSDMSARFLDRLSGMTTLRLFRAVARTRAEFEHLAGDYRRATMRVLRIAFLSSASLELFSALGIALTAIYVGYHYLGYADFGSYGLPITIASGLYLLLLAPDFFMPMREFAAAYHDKATAQSAAERLLQILPQDQLENATAALSEPGLKDDPDARAPDDAPLSIGSFAFEGCALGYSGERGAILKDVSLSVDRGQSVAILGRSGAGKSTLLAALCGFLPPSEGVLLVDGSPAPDTKAGWDILRQTIAWIGQRPHIFHGSLLMNARLAAPNATRDEINAALGLAHADHFVSQLPRDLLTILGETGFGISGGQVRRLAIARAALSQSSLILCDEPTADLDAETAALVTDSLMEMATGRILMVATHDIEVARRCQRIFYVHDGAVRAIDLAEAERLAAAHELDDISALQEEEQGMIEQTKEQSALGGSAE